LKKVPSATLKFAPVRLRADADGAVREQVGDVVGAAVRTSGVVPCRIVRVPERLEELLVAPGTVPVTEAKRVALLGMYGKRRDLAAVGEDPLRPIRPVPAFLDGTKTLSTPSFVPKTSTMSGCCAIVSVKPRLRLLDDSAWDHLGYP